MAILTGKEKSKPRKPIKSTRVKLATGTARYSKNKAIQKRSTLARKTIMTAGEALFSRCGYVGTTLDAVAKLAGLSKQRLIHYYENKPALYAAVIEYAFQPINEIDDLVVTTDQADFTLVERWIDILARRPSIARLIMFGSILPENADTPPVFTNMGINSIKTFESGFKQLVPKASKNDFYHFACALSGTTLFYAMLMDERSAVMSQQEKAQALAQHKTMVLLSVKNLLQTMQYQEDSASVSD